MTIRPASSIDRSFVDVRSLVFWVMVGLTGYGLIHIAPLLSNSLTQYPAAGLVSAVLWSAYGLVLMLLLYRLELFERRSPLTMVGAFVWGAVVVSGIGTIAGPAVNELILKIGVPDGWAAAISAGVTEEPLKMLGVVALALIPRARVNSPIDGLYFGLIVGLGFEVTESYLYTVTGSIQEGGTFMVILLTFVLRGIIGGLWNHPTFTAITGSGVGYFFGAAASLLRRTLVMVGSLLAAIALHAFFDSPVLEGNPLVSTVVKGLPTLILFIVVFRIAQAKERRRFARIGETQVPRDLITEDELTVLASRKARRRARREERHLSGFAGAHAMKRLQRTQTELVDAMADDGPDADRTSELAADVREAQRVLLETRQPVAVPA